MSVLAQVRGEIAAGTPTVQAMALRTGVSEEVIRAAVDHLVRAGEAVATPLASGCPVDARCHSLWCVTMCAKRKTPSHFAYD